MKKISPTIAYALLLLGLLSAGCEKSERGLPRLQNKQLIVLDVSTEGCIPHLKSTEIEQYIELKAEERNQLRLKFTNATLNCCPGEISSMAYIKDGILKVMFMEETPAMCDCICEFNLECLIIEMENRSYNLEVYAHSEEPIAKLLFTYSPDLDTKIKISDD